MDSVDSAILNVIQSDFPLVPRPYGKIAGDLGLSEDAVLARVNALREAGLIRRIGANFQSRKLGFASTLCAAKVPPESLDAFVRAVNARPEVTHNYLRRHEYNVWFTVIARDRAAIADVLRDIADETGIPVHDLPAARMYKIKVDFRMGEE